jgi:protease I
MELLAGKFIAMLVENGFEEVELTSPKKALEEAGAVVHIVSPQKDKVKAWDHDHWSTEIPVDVQIEDADVVDYDGLVLPGGVINPDMLRTNKACVEFVQQFFQSGKTIAAICHGPQVLIETACIRGRKVTSYPSIKTDLINAGANWVDEEVVVDEGLITSRSPKDLDAFNSKLVEELKEGLHAACPAY